MLLFFYNCVCIIYENFPNTLHKVREAAEMLQVLFFNAVCW